MGKVRIGEQVVMIGDDNHKPTVEEIEEVASQLEIKAPEAPETEKAPETEPEQAQPNFIQRAVSGALESPVIGEAVRSVPALQAAGAAERTARAVTDPIQSRIKQAISPVTGPILEALPEQPFLKKKDRPLTSLLPVLEQGEMILESVSPKDIGLLAEDIFTDPLILAPGAVKGVRKLAGVVSESLPLAQRIATQARKQAKVGSKIAKLDKKVEAITIEITQPSAKKLAQAQRAGRSLPEVREASKVIQKSKDFDEMADGVRVAKNEVVKSRNALIAKDKRPVTDDYIKGLESKIAEAKSPGSQFKKSEIAQMEFVLNEERKFFEQAKTKFKGFDKKIAQLRKQFFQGRTQNILKKRELGTLSAKENARASAEDELRFGLKLGIENGNSKIKKANAIAEGLIGAEENISKLQASAQLRPTQSIVRNLLNDLHSSIAFSPQMTAARLVGKSITGGTSLANKTSQIVKLREKAKRLSAVSEGIESGLLKLKGINS